MKKSLIAGMTSLGILLAAGAPMNAMADAPPFYQYEGKSLPATQIAQYDSLSGLGGTEILAYDPLSKLAFVTNGVDLGIDILSFADLKNGEFTRIDSKKRVFLKDFGMEHVKDITSVAVHPTADLVAVSIVSNPSTDRGYIAFMTKDGEFLTKVQVGSLPDMVTFTPDGKKAVVANEGEPNSDYSIDPEGSISVIAIPAVMKKGEEITAKMLSFDNIPLDDKVRVSSKGTIVQQLEPEYVTISPDSKKAYVSLQENNAIATVDLVSDQIIDVKGLGVKDHSVAGNELDAKRNGKTEIEKLPLLGYYMPDAIDLFSSNGTTYILTPNEGDSRDYDAYSEEAKIKEIKDEIQLNADHYQGYTQAELDKLVEDGLLDELADTLITTENGKVDGKYEALHTYGGRSFSIFDADTMELVYDSGSEFERIIAEALPEYFNTNHDEISYDKRSASKGPEPETVVHGMIAGKQYAFIALERLSGIMVYDITSPKDAKFVTLLSSRDFSGDVKGDVSPEGLRFISAEESPTGAPLLAATHEVSGTVAVYEFGEGIGEKPFPFTDVDKNSWAYAYINDLFQKNIVSGKTETRFAPNESITQGEFFATITHALNLKAGTVFGDEVDNRFSPNEKLTREQMATIIVQAYEYKTGLEVSGENTQAYYDLDQIDKPTKEYIQKAFRLGIMEGQPNGTFNPKENSTRAHVAKVVSLLLHELKD